LLRALALIVTATAGSVSVAATLSGTVTDEQGLPLVNVDLDFILVANGDNIDPLDSDTTDATGAYSSTLPPGVYDVRFIPLAGSLLAGHEEESVNLNVNQTLNVVLRNARFVTGQVLRADTGLAAIGVDLDFNDLATDLKIFTPRDSTDAAGNYSVAVPSGIYEVTFDGPEPDLPSDPAQLAHGLIEEISVTGASDVALPTMTLELGYLLEGDVFDFIGIPIAGADLDLIVSGTGERVFTKNDNTDSAGSYQTIVPAGTYDVEINPPLTQPVVSALHTGVVVTADTFVATDFLLAGNAVSGTVRDPDGHPLRKVDLDLFSASTGAPVPTPHDDTDGTGQYATRVASGTFDVAYDPLVNRLVVEQTSFGVGVSGDIVLADMILPYHDSDADGLADLMDDCPFLADGSQPDQEDNDRDRAGDACDGDDDNDGIADGADTDIDGDLVTNGVDNCAQSYNPDQIDSDADGVGNACDSDDGEVELLEAAGLGGFVWRAEDGATGYQIYRQRLEWLSTINYGACTHDVVEGNVLVDQDLPEPGRAFIYVVTADTAFGEGRLGNDSAGNERPNLRACP
jgi:hypothetical protein